MVAALRALGVDAPVLDELAETPLLGGGAAGRLGPLRACEHHGRDRRHRRAPWRDDDGPAARRARGWPSRRADGPRRPFLLVHGLASNARLWDGVGPPARRRRARGRRRRPARPRPVRAGRRRAHAPSRPRPTSRRCRSDARSGGGARTDRRSGSPGAATSSSTLAAEHGGVAGLGLVDGGWIALGEPLPDLRAVLGRAGAAGLRRRAARRAAPSGSAAGTPTGRRRASEGALANFAESPDGTAAPAARPRAPPRDPAVAVGGRRARALPAGAGARRCSPPRGPPTASAERRGRAAPRPPLLADAGRWYDGRRPRPARPAPRPAGRRPGWPSPPGWTGSA